LTQTLLHGETRMRRDPAATASGGGSASNLWLFVRIAEFERRRTRKGASKITIERVAAALRSFASIKNRTRDRTALPAGDPPLPFQRLLPAPATTARRSRVETPPATLVQSLIRKEIRSRLCAFSDLPTFFLRFLMMRILKDDSLTCRLCSLLRFGDCRLCRRRPFA